MSYAKCLHYICYENTTKFYRSTPTPLGDDTRMALGSRNEPHAGLLLSYPNVPLTLLCNIFNTTLLLYMQGNPPHLARKSCSYDL